MGLSDEVLARLERMLLHEHAAQEALVALPPAPGTTPQSSWNSEAALLRAVAATQRATSQVNLARSYLSLILETLPANFALQHFAPTPANDGSGSVDAPD